MRAIMSRRGMLAVIGLLATVSTAACTATRASTSAGPGSHQPATPAAAAAASPTPTAAATPPAAAPSATPTGPGAVENLVVTSGEKSELTAAFAAFQEVPVSYEGGGPLPGSVYYAYEPATDTYWARATFISGAYPDPGETDVVMFQQPGAGPWIVEGDRSQCVQIGWFPQAVLMAWSMPTSLQAGVSC